MYKDINEFIDYKIDNLNYEISVIDELENPNKYALKLRKDYKENLDIMKEIKEKLEVLEILKKYLKIRCWGSDKFQTVDINIRNVNFGEDEDFKKIEKFIYDDKK